jgi:DNA-binding MarR family transcriptional regulator
MTTISAPVSASVQTESREALLAFLDALTLAEPIQAKLWQLGEITLTQVSVLRRLREGPQTVGHLGQNVGLSPASMTRLVDRLERRGLVGRRRESEDRRVVEVHLEPAGERLLGEAKVFRGSDLHLAVAAMTREERKRMTVALRRLVVLAREIAGSDRERA